MALISSEKKFWNVSIWNNLCTLRIYNKSIGYREQNADVSTKLDLSHLRWVSNRVTSSFIVLYILSIHVCDYHFWKITELLYRLYVNNIAWVARQFVVLACFEDFSR